LVWCCGDSDDIIVWDLLLRGSILISFDKGDDEEDNRFFSKLVI